MKNLIYTLALVVIGITSGHAQQTGKLKIETKEDKRKVEDRKPNEKVERLEFRDRKLDRAQIEKIHRLQRLRKIERRHRIHDRLRFERRQFKYDNRRLGIEGRRFKSRNRHEDVIHRGRIEGRRLDAGNKHEDIVVEGRRLAGRDRRDNVVVGGRIQGRMLEGRNLREDVIVQGRRFEGSNNLTAEQRAENKASAMQKRLNLTDKQKQEIQSIELGNIKKNEEWRLQDEKEMKSKMEERKAFMNSSKEKMDKILTEEQRKNLGDVREGLRRTPPPPPVRN